MKNRIFKYILVIIFVIFSGNLIQAQDYQSEATFIKLIKEYQLNADGSFDFNCSKQLKLNSYFAVNRLYGETFIVYNPKYQELKINESYTIMADGKKVVTPENAFNEVLPRYAANAPAFNNLREMVVTHTGLERNAIINLDYTIHSSMDFLPDFFGKESLTQSAPVNEMIFRIKVPADKTLQFKTLNIRTAPEITDEDGMKVYTWTFKNLKAISHDYNRPAHNVFLPGIIFSTAKDLHHVYDKFVDNKSFYYISNKAMTAVVDDMLAKEKDQMKIILDLQKLVVNDINYWNIPLEMTAYKCRKAVVVWNSNGGTSLEKTMLLASMLVKAGIKAVPVAVIPDKFYDPAIGCLKTFDNFLVRIYDKKHKDIYLSAIHLNDQNLKYSLSGNTLLTLDPTIESLKTYSCEQAENKVEFECELIIENENKISGEAKIELSGSSNPYFKLLKNEKVAERFFSSSKVISFDIKNQKMDYSKINYSIEMNDSFEKHDNYYFMNLPQVKEGSGSWYLSAFTESRSANIEIPFTINESYEYSIEIPKGFSLVSPENKDEITHNIGSVYLEIKKNKDKVKIIRKISLNKKIIELTEYDDFKELIKAWKSKKYKQLIVKEL